MDTGRQNIVIASHQFSDFLHNIILKNQTGSFHFFSMTQTIHSRSIAFIFHSSIWSVQQVRWFRCKTHKIHHHEVHIHKSCTFFPVRLKGSLMKLIHCNSPLFHKPWCHRYTGFSSFQFAHYNMISSCKISMFCMNLLLKHSNIFFFITKSDLQILFGFFVI